MQTLYFCLFLTDHFSKITLNSAPIMIEIMLPCLCVCCGPYSSRVGIMISHSYSLLLPFPTASGGRMYLIMALCTPWERPSSDRIHPVITDAGSCLISNVLAVSCFIGKGLTRLDIQPVPVEIHVFSVFDWIEDLWVGT